MTLKVVGAGLGRTGTNSLKIALADLLGGACYHMTEVFPHPEHLPVWTDAVHGRPVEWETVFAGYVATVDWPGAAVWEDILAAYPGAVVLLSTRASAAEWWRSFSATIGEVMARPADAGDPWLAMARPMLERFTPDWSDPDAAQAAYEAHNQHVRDSAPAGRLIEWKPEDGWGPLCRGLGLPVPGHDFPHVNTTSEFRAMSGLDAGT